MEKTKEQIKEERAALRREKAASRKEARRLLKEAGFLKRCEYCEINEKDFPDVWGSFYNGKRGKRLEPDHKDNNYKNNDINNLCWACCLCNCAKSDKLTHEEMQEVGAVIGKLWRKRAGSNKVL